MLSFSLNSILLQIRLPHMPKSLNEPSLLAVGAELGIVGGGGVEL